MRSGKWVWPIGLPAARAASQAQARSPPALRRAAAACPPRPVAAQRLANAPPSSAGARPASQQASSKAAAASGRPCCRRGPSGVGCVMLLCVCVWPSWYGWGRKGAGSMACMQRLDAFTGGGGAHGLSGLPSHCHGGRDAVGKHAGSSGVGNDLRCAHRNAAPCCGGGHARQHKPLCVPSPVSAGNAPT